MPQTAASPSPHVPDFEGLLAAIARPPSNPEIDQDEGGFAEDVATLSYESALRTYARYKPSTPIDPALMRASRSSGIPAPSESIPRPTGRANSQAQPFVGLGMKSSAGVPNARDPDRKSASITIRLSGEERDLLRQRAAEAELTVSAYLRSCTLEVETLRTQVKDALTALRKSSAEINCMAGREDMVRRSREIKFSDRPGRIGRIWSSLFQRRSS
jgi:hypothetical protein